MSKYKLQSQLKNKGTLNITWLLGVQYAYLGNWGKQILYWCTLFGVGIWALRDLFRLQKMLDTYNAPILDELEKMDNNS